MLISSGALWAAASMHNGGVTMKTTVAMEATKKAVRLRLALETSFAVQTVVV